MTEIYQSGTLSTIVQASSKIKVVHSFYGRMGYPSTGLSAYYLARESARCGCRVTAISTSFDRHPYPASSKATLELAGRRIPLKILGRKLAVKIHDHLVARYIRDNALQTNIVHCWSGSALRTIIQAKRNNILTILHRSNAHTQFAFDVVAKEHARLAIPLPKGYSHSFDRQRLEREEREYELADFIAVTSDFVARTFLQKGFSDKKIIKIFYGYNPAIFYPNPDHNEPAPSGDKRLNIAFIGRGEPRKGLHYALQAWIETGLYRKGNFLLAGNFDLFPAYKKYLKNWLDHPNVNVLGELKDVASVLRSADILLLPSLEEGSAKVIFEAMACGCVPLVSDHSGAICKHGYDGLIHRAGNLEELKSHLLELAHAPDHLQKLRNNALTRIKNYTWHDAGKHLAEQYGKLVGKTDRDS